MGTDRRIYYHMGEVAEMLDVPPTLIRYWEKHFSALAPARNKKGNRLFTPADVETLKRIYHLVKEKRMTLAGAEKALKTRGGSVGRDAELMERLLSVRALLEEIRQELKEGADATPPLPAANETSPECDGSAPETPNGTPSAPQPAPQAAEDPDSPMFVQQTLF